MRPHIALILLFVLLTAAGCTRKTENKQPERHFQLTGEIMSLNEKDQTATIKHGPIPNWMEAMTMEYPIRTKTDFSSLHVGEKIRATVDVRDDADYSLSNVRPLDAGK